MDRFGQRAPTVRVLTYYGIDNQIDGVVLDVLLRKHKTIRSSLGISVPVPVNTEDVVEAIFEGLLLRSRPSALENYLPGFEEFMRPQKEDLYGKWDAASEREKRSRTLFAQETIKVDEVSRELQAARAAVGAGVDVKAFAQQSLRLLGGVVSANGKMDVDLTETPQALRDMMAQAIGPAFKPKFSACFDLPVSEGQLLLTRTHPVMENLSAFILESALDPLSAHGIQNPARRAGAIRTSGVARRTTLLLVRFRYHILTRRGKSSEEKPLLAEELVSLAFTGSPENAEWLEAEQAEKLLQLAPEANVSQDQAREFIRRMIDGYEFLRPHLEDTAVNLGEELLAAHQRVRLASRQTNLHTRIEPTLPPDVIGIYLYLPKA